MTDRPVADGISRALMIAGTTLAGASVAAWLLHFMPSIPLWMVQLAIYKITFVSGLGMVIAGARARRYMRLVGSARHAELGPGDASPELRNHAERVRSAQEER